MENAKELVELVKPICEWIEKYGNPHTQVQIAIDYMRVTEDVVGVPMNKDC